MKKEEEKAKHRRRRCVLELRRFKTELLVVFKGKKKVLVVVVVAVVITRAPSLLCQCSQFVSLAYVLIESVVDGRDEFGALVARARLRTLRADGAGSLSLLLSLQLPPPCNPPRFCRLCHTHTVLMKSNRFTVKKRSHLK